MKLLGILALLMVVALAQNNDIDLVLKMLQDLKNGSAQELELLSKQIADTRAQKEGLITTLNKSVSAQRDQCNKRDQDVANKERDITITLSFMKWLEKRMKENNERVARLEINRCESNSNFINDIKNSKKALNLIKYLRKAIKNAKESDLPALLQSEELNQLYKYASLIEKHSFLQDDGDVDPADDNQAETNEDDTQENDTNSEDDTETNEDDATSDLEEADASELASLAEENGEATSSANSSNASEDSNEVEESGEESELDGAEESADEESGDDEESEEGESETSEESDSESEDDTEPIQGADDEEDGLTGQSGAAPTANPLEDAEAQENEDLQKQSEAFNKIIARGQKGEATTADAPATGPDYSSFTAAQQELLRFLDQMESEVSGTFSTVQDNQVKSAMGFNDFKGLIHKENDAFKGHLASEDENLIKLQNQLITVLQASAACKSRLKQIAQSVDLANEDLANSLAHFGSVKERLEEELNTFDDVYRIYASQVGSTSSDYKQGVQSRINH